MAVLLFANNATTTLAGPLTGTAVTLNVAAGTGVLFPQPGSGQYFKLTLTDANTGLINEIVHVTAVNGDAFTIVRGQENTAPAQWQAGDLADNLPTAGTMQAFAQTAAITSGAFQGTDTSTSPNSVTVPTTTPAISAPVQGQYFEIVKGSQSNTGPTTLTVGSGGQAASVVYKDGSALVNNAWPANAAAILYYTGGVYQFVACLGPPQGATVNGGLALDPNSQLLLAFQNLLADNRAAPVASDVLALERMSDGATVSVSASALASYILSNIVATGTFQQVVQNPVLRVDCVNGSDSTGDGSAGKPFKTIQFAATAGSNKYNFATTSLTIMLAQVNGNYAAPGYLPVGSGPINITGDTSGSNAAAFVISGSGSGVTGALIVAQSVVNLTGVTVQNTGNSVHNFANVSGSTCNLTNVASVVTGTLPNNAHFFGKNIQFNTGCTVQGNAVAAWWAAGPGTMQINFNTSLAILNNPTFSIATLYQTDRSGFALLGGASVTGSATGKRYLVQGNSVATTNIAAPNNATAIPGTTAGTTDTGGQYS